MKKITSPLKSSLCLVIWVLSFLSCQASGSNSTKFECVAVEGTPEFEFVPAHSTIGCAIRCAQSASCQLFVWNVTQEEHCQIATTSPSGTTLTALYVAQDADFITFPLSDPDSFCPYVGGPELVYANIVTPEVVYPDTVTPEVVYPDTVTPEEITVTPVSVTTPGPLVNLGEGGSWSDCKDNCLDGGLNMIPCPASRDFLEDIAADYGITAKVYLYGFRAANTDNFLDPSGNVVIELDSPLWGGGQPDDRRDVNDLDCGLYTVWKNVVDTKDIEFTQDPKICVCW